MNVLVAYLSQTGNTKKVAEAIYSVIPTPKEMTRIEDITSLESYDLSFLGFPIQGWGGPDEPVTHFLTTHVKDRTIALFITHAAPEDAPPLQGWIQKFKDAAVGANIVGVFDCQGELAQQIKDAMLKHPNPENRAWAEADTSQGQPDATRLTRAKEFAREIMNTVTQEISIEKRD
jgi:flavodoxin